MKKQGSIRALQFNDFTVLSRNVQHKEGLSSQKHLEFSLMNTCKIHKGFLPFSEVLWII